MNLAKDGIPTRTAFNAIAPSRSLADAEEQADSLLERAQDAQVEQAALLYVTPLESQYSAALAAQVQAKHDQVDRIEDKLEDLIEQQFSRLQQAQAQQPGLLALPGARAKWQRQIQQQQIVMQRLQGRLENVREIRDGIGIHGSRIEELATRKLRAQEPGLVAEFDDMREAQRRHQAMLRKQKQVKRQAQEPEQRDRFGKSLSLKLSQAR